MENKFNLLVVLQSHSVGSRDPEHDRFINASKMEISRRCIHSLIDSLNYAYLKDPLLHIELAILDDHSDQEHLDNLDKMLETAKFNFKIIHLETRGCMPSILAQYQYGKEHGEHLVYFAQDDYLHEESCIKDMIETQQMTSANLGQHTCIYPWNNPFHYSKENILIKSHIIRSSGRHWRTNIMTASCFMTHVETIRKEWDLFYDMGTHEVGPTMEDETINQLFRSRGYYLFIPIPSLAFHLQWDEDHLADWRSLWNKYQLPKEQPEEA